MFFKSTIGKQRKEKVINARARSNPSFFAIEKGYNISVRIQTGKYKGGQIRYARVGLSIQTIFHLYLFYSLLLSAYLCCSRCCLLCRP